MAQATRFTRNVGGEGFLPCRIQDFNPRSPLVTTTVNLDDLLTAMEWLSSGESAGMNCEAWVSLLTGTVHWSGEGVDEPLPEDIDDAGIYVAVPRKQDLELGRSLALRFTEEYMPRSVNTVQGFFHARGAWSRFKSLLEQVNQLENWYQYELNATGQALRDWAQEQGLRVVD